MTDTDPNTDTGTDDNTVEIAFCPACMQEQSWVILEALAKPFGGVENPNLGKIMRDAAPALCDAIEMVLAPFLDLENAEHEPDEDAERVH